MYSIVCIVFRDSATRFSTPYSGSKGNSFQFCFDFAKIFDENSIKWLGLYSFNKEARVVLIQ